MATDNFCFFLQNRLIQTSQTGGQRYSDTSPFSIPCPDYQWLKSGLCPGGTEVEPSSLFPEMVGSNLTAVTMKEKIAKKYQIIF